MGFLTAHPLVAGVLAALTGFSVSVFVLRWEIRAQLRQRRRGGFLVGGER